MTVPPKYGLQTWIGGVVILMGLGFVGAQLLAPRASTANNTQAVASRPAPRIIEIHTKRTEPTEPATTEAKRIEPARVDPVAIPAQPAQPPAPNFAEVGPPPVSAEELKRKAQEEMDEQVVEESAPKPARTHTRQRYPRYDRHAVQ